MNDLENENFYQISTDY